jgi:hypothetical protein
MTEDRMADEEARLAELLRGDLPPVRDALFRLDVLARCERQRFRRQLAMALTVGAVSALRRLVSPLVALVTQTVSRAFVD